MIARADLHLRRLLLALRSPARWVRQSVGSALSSAHSSCVVVVVHALMRHFDESRGKQALALARAARDKLDADLDRERRSILPKAERLALGDEENSDDEGAANGSSQASAAAAAAADQIRLSRAVAREQLELQKQLTRLMRLMAQHRGMATALEQSPELLRQMATFVRRVGESLFAPARQLLKTGRPGGGLLDCVNPDKQLPWCIDFLAMVGGLADAICRKREGRRDGEYASLLPGVSETVWPLSERYALFESLKLWSARTRRRRQPSPSAVPRASSAPKYYFATGLRLSLVCFPIPFSFLRSHWATWRLVALCSSVL